MTSPKRSAIRPCYIKLASDLRRPSIHLVIGMTRSDALRLLTAIAACMVVVGLFVGGTRSMAMNLVPMLWDKLAHGTTYFVLTVLMYVTSRSLRWAAPLGLAVSVLDELHRASAIGSNASVQHWLADTVGIFMACMVVARIRRPMLQRINHGP